MEQGEGHESRVPLLFSDYAILWEIKTFPINTTVNCHMMQKLLIHV